MANPAVKCRVSAFTENTLPDRIRVTVVRLARLGFPDVALRAALRRARHPHVVFVSPLGSTVLQAGHAKCSGDRARSAGILAVRAPAATGCVAARPAGAARQRSISAVYVFATAGTRSHTDNCQANKERAFKK